MTDFGLVLRGIMLVIVVMVLVTIAAQDFKELTFAEEEWEDLTGSFDAFNAETIIDPLEEPGLLDAPQDSDPDEETPPGFDAWAWVAGAVSTLPVISEIVEATVAVAQAIWAGVIAFVDMMQKGLNALLALSRFLFAIATFDIPALTAHPFLQMIRLLVVLPLWVGIPYLVVRMIRGGG